MAEHAGRGRFSVEPVPAGWALIAPGGRRWTLAREAAARQYAEAANRAPTAAALRRTLAAVEGETAAAWYQRSLRERAADALLDAAAGHAFEDPTRAADVVRWSRLRRQESELAARLTGGPASFGRLRAEREHPALWAALPDPRHQYVPAWLRFREAAETWLRVHAGEPWEPPTAFPAPPALAEPPSQATAALPREQHSVVASSGPPSAGDLSDFGFGEAFHQSREPGLNL